MALTSYGRPLMALSSLKYLGRFLLASDNDWPAVIWNLRRVRHKWAYLSQVIRRYGSDACMLGIFYISVVQVVLLYRSESWVVSPQIGKALGRIHHWEIQRITG